MHTASSNAAQAHPVLSTETWRQEFIHGTTAFVQPCQKRVKLQVYIKIVTLLLHTKKWNVDTWYNITRACHRERHDNGFSISTQFHRGILKRYILYLAHKYIMRHSLKTSASAGWNNVFFLHVISNGKNKHLRAIEVSNKRGVSPQWLDLAVCIMNLNAVWACLIHVCDFTSQESESVIIFSSIKLETNKGSLICQWMHCEIQCIVECVSPKVTLRTSQQMFQALSIAMGYGCILMWRAWNYEGFSPHPGLNFDPVLNHG